MPRGIVWRSLTFQASFGRPFAEWAYVTPRYPDGLCESDFQASPPEIQSETAEVWFLSNFQPISDQRWRGGGYAPSDRHVPSEHLRDEFSSIVDMPLAHLAAELQAVSSFWEPITDRAPGFLPPAINAPALQGIDVDGPLTSLEFLATSVLALRGNMGHNQGPPLPDNHQIAVIVEAILQTRQGIMEGSAGKSQVKSAKEKMRNVMLAIGASLLAGMTYKAGQEAWGPVELLAIHLFHSLHAATDALTHWLTASFKTPN